MLNIMFVSDYVCPYCLVAKEVLKKALEITGLEADITWQPFELTEEPNPRVDTCHDEVRKARYQVLVEPCAALGLDMKLPPVVCPRPYTRLAFEGWYYACKKGKGDLYNDLIYRSYFIDEKDIGDIEILTELAKTVGLDGAEFKQVLECGVYTQIEKEAVSFAKDVLEIKGVPTIYLNGNKISFSKFTVEEMVGILQKELVSQENAAFSCGVDGCH